MNKMVVFALIGLMVGGCASIDSVEETNQKIAELEKRVTELEKTRGGGSSVLSRRGRPLVKSAENAVLSEAEKAKREAERDAERAAEREQQRQQLLAIQEELKRTREAREAAMAAEMAASKKEDHVEVGKKVNGFLKEHFGVQFGDSGGSFTNVIKECRGNLLRQRRVSDPLKRELPMLKKRWYFTTATGHFLDDKLIQIDIHATIDAKYSAVSCDEEFKKTLADFEEEFKLHKGRIVPYYSELPKVKGEIATDYRFGQAVSDEKSENSRSYTFSIADLKGESNIRKMQEGQRRLEAEKRKAEEEKKRAKGEPLPEIK